MSLVLTKLARGLFLAGWLWAALGSADAQQPKPRRAPKIYFTEPGATGTSTNAIVATNATETTPKKPALGVLDRTVRKPFEFFNAQDSFSGVSAPPTQRGRPSALNSKRARDLLDRKKNWVFNTPEDIYGLQTPEQMMNVPEYGPDGEEKKPKTILERYFERMEKNRTDAATNRVRNDSLPDWLKPDDSEERLSSDNDDKGSDRSIFGPGKANSKHTSANSEFTGPLGGGASPAEKSYSEFFNLGSSGAGSKPVVPDAALAGRMQAFKQLLDSRSPASPGLGAGFDVTAPSSPALSPLQSPFSAGMFGRDSFSPQPAPRPSSLPAISPGTTLPSAYAPAFKPPPAAPLSRTFTPPAPAFELPQRKF